MVARVIDAGELEGDEEVGRNGCRVAGLAGGAGRKAGGLEARNFEARPSGACYSLAVAEEQQILDAGKSRGEAPALRRGHDGECCGEGPGFGGVSGDHGRAEDGVDGLTGARVDDVGEVSALDVDASAVGAAGGDGAVGEADEVDG